MAIGAICEADLGQDSEYPDGVTIRDDCGRVLLFSFGDEADAGHTSGMDEDLVTLHRWVVGWMDSWVGREEEREMDIMDIYREMDAERDFPEWVWYCPLIHM